MTTELRHGLLKKLKEAIDASEVVSFDIFDTLIMRLYRKPTDLFRHLEESENATGFYEARISAEMAAREDANKKGLHEVSLQQIYDKLHTSYRPLMEKEIKLELFACRANPEMLEVYRELKSEGKRLFISSDMYLPEAVITEILRNAGYDGYEKLLLSSTTLRPKATGEMYGDLIRAAGCAPEKILHVGDHAFTDYEVAQREGIHAYLYSPLQETYGGNLNSAFFACINRNAERDIALSMLEPMIAIDNFSQERSYWERFGFQYIGIIAYAYVKWLKSRFDAEGIDRAYFMLRDGYIFKRVFDAVYPGFDTLEMYGSRRLFLLSGAEKYEDIKFHLTGSHVSGVTYEQIWKRLAIDDDALHNEYLDEFQDLSALVDGKEALKKVDEFFSNHFAEIAQIGAAERKTLDEYFQQIALSEKKAAVIDLGWKGSMMRGLELIASRLSMKTDLTGFYLGTHECNTAGLRVESYLLDHGKSTGAKNADVLKDYGYVIPILELAFSAPHPSILGLKIEKGHVLPVFQDVCEPEKRRNQISAEILKGVLDCVAELEKTMKAAAFDVSKEAALTPLQYFSECISKADEFELLKVHFLPGIGNESVSYPIVKTGYPEIAVINPWPGDISAEFEVIERMKRAAREIGVTLHVTDNYGWILDENQKRTGMLVDPQRLLFAISTHYETPKTIDTFYYHTLWNPPEIPLNLDYYEERASCQYLMNDDYLIYDFGGMSNHLRGMLLNKPRTLEDASCLVASFPTSAMLEPDLRDPLMFYCGMNWEKATKNPERHEGLFKLLDGTDKVRFYGPESVPAWGGLRPWDGYKCYQHSIPFDGFSILKEINKCGICLVLSSDIHRRAGAASNRVYEACAAGAVIISDDNSFVLHYFKDAALFIEYNMNDPLDTFRQIMEKYEWVVAHPEEAKELVRRAQKIFRERFALDMQLRQIIERHGKRESQIARDLFAKTDSEKVLVTFVANALDVGRLQTQLDAVFKNVQNQLYHNIQLAIAVDNSVFQSVKEYCERYCTNTKPFGMQLFDHKGSRFMTDGQAIRRLQRLNEHDYYINTTEKEIWFYDHVTTLVRTLADTGSPCAFSGTMRCDCNSFRFTACFSSLGRRELYDEIFDSRYLPAAGQFMFSEQAEGFLPDYLFDCIDGKEHYAYCNILKYKYGYSLEFSQRMTLAFRQDAMPNGGCVLDDKRQSRFIRELVKLFVPEVTTSVVQASDASAASATAPSLTGFSDFLLYFPIKLYIKLRYYRYRLRKLKPGSAKYDIFSKKYNATLNQYEAYRRGQG